MDQQRPAIGGAAPVLQDETASHASDILEAASYELKLDKSNILMLGPTGTGKMKQLILETILKN